MLLAIDTSTNYASLALTDDDTLLAELNWRVGRRHGAETLERARWLLQGQGIEMHQLDGIAVALGPGSFNGARVAVTTAKALAFALGIPLYGIPTLDVTAWGARLAPTPIWALLDAGRGEVFTSCYNGATAPADWAPQPAADGASSPYVIITPEALSERISGGAVFTGEWRDATHDALVSALGERAHFVAQAESRRGAWLAELATARARRGAADDPHTLEPLYVRRPNITKSARRPSVASTDQPGGGEAAHAL